METSDLLMRIVYAATLPTAGVVGWLCLFHPTLGSRIGFAGTAEPSPAVRVSGAFWFALALLSAVGIWYPRELVLVLVVQLLYKGLWLLVDVFPKLLRGRASQAPKVMASLFVIFVLVLPVAIPWADLLARF